MLRNKFTRELEALKLELVHMGALVEHAIDDSIGALLQQDVELCNKVIEAEKTIDALRSDIEGKALRILLMQQPVASDLRMISTALKTIIDMERISDQARDICDIVLTLCDQKYSVGLDIIPQMAELSRTMVRHSVDSFVKNDVELAEKVTGSDDNMDALFSQLKAKMIKLLKKRPEHSDQFIYFLMIGKYFEKIGDHAENIAKWVLASANKKKKHSI